MICSRTQVPKNYGTIFSILKFFWCFLPCRNFEGQESKGATVAAPLSDPRKVQKIIQTVHWIQIRGFYPHTVPNSQMVLYFSPSRKFEFFSNEILNIHSKNVVLPGHSVKHKEKFQHQKIFVIFWVFGKNNFLSNFQELFGVIFEKKIFFGH